MERITDFDQFDTYFTAKLHGYKDATEFYERASPHTRLQDIRLPTLILNAKNDPSLGKECYPTDFTQASSSILLEVPKRGGNMGFTIPGSEFTYAE